MSRYRRGRYYKARSAGHNAAIRHIQEAREFSRSVGGTDEDIKKIFFNLTNNSLNKLFEVYGRDYGADKESYARNAYHKWKSGHTKMSGMIAERLFNILPRFLPIEVKLNLVKSLWDHTKPTSNQTIQVKDEDDPNAIKHQVHAYFTEKLSKHMIPDDFTRRFKWLAGDDSNVRQELENYFMGLQGSLSLEQAYQVIDALYAQMSATEGNYSAQHEIKVGGHSVVVSFRRVKEDLFEKYGCLTFIIAAVILYLIFK